MVSLLKKTLRTTGGLFLIAAGALGVAAGCSSTETNGVDPLATLQGFCQQYAIAKCATPIVISCFGANPNDANAVDSDTQACIAAVQRPDRCNPASLPYHEENAQAALTTIENVYEDGQLDGPGGADNEIQDLADALDSVFYTPNGPGAKCTANNECDIGGGLSCVVHNGKGTCQSPIDTSAGQSCALISAQCESGFYCNSTLNCVAVGSATQACVSDDQCVTGRCANKTCERLKVDMSACELDTECAGGFCLKQSGDTKNGQCAGRDNFSLFSESCQAFKQ